jgi:hypothetical protein
MTDNIFKFLDALDFADEFELDAVAYICNRDKAVDRVDHRWLIRLLCFYCGVVLPLYETLAQYSQDPPPTSPGCYTVGDCDQDSQDMCARLLSTVPSPPRGAYSAQY